MSLADDLNKRRSVLHKLSRAELVEQVLEVEVARDVYLDDRENERAKVLALRGQVDDLTAALRTLHDELDKRILGADHPWVPGTEFHDGVLVAALDAAQELLTPADELEERERHPLR